MYKYRNLFFFVSDQHFNNILEIENPSRSVYISCEVFPEGKRNDRAEISFKLSNVKTSNVKKKCFPLKLKKMHCQTNFSAHVSDEYFNCEKNGGRPGHGVWREKHFEK